VLFVLCIVASYVSANRHLMPVLELNGADRGLIFASAWLGILLLAADGIDSLDRLKTLLRRVVLGATAMAILGEIQFFTGLDAVKYIYIPGLTAQIPFSDLLSRADFNRPSATALHPIEFGAVLVMSLPLAIHQARFASPGMRLRRWLQVIIIGMALPMTVSRSAILGLVVVLLVLLPTWPKRDRRTAYLVILLSSVAMWATVHGLAGTIRSLFLNISSDTSTTSRTSALSVASSFLAQHPWFGRGFGTFLPQVYRFLDDQYLGSLIETGIVGFLGLVALFITGWLAARNARRISINPETRHLGQCLAASVGAAAVSFATYDALSFPMGAGLTFLVLGSAGALWRLVRTEELAGPMGKPVGIRSRVAHIVPTHHV
jgi:O-antigen ligase